MGLLVGSLSAPYGRYSAKWSGGVAILAPGEIPTVDFYLTPRLRDLAPSLIFRFDSRHFDASAGRLPQGTMVVIVRHAAKRWLQFLEAQSRRWCGVAYLMDDDIPGAWRCRDVPLDYGLWTSGRYFWAGGGLARVCDQVWLSTDALRRRFGLLNAKLVGPLPFGPSREVAPAGTRRWGYHGTRIHGREVRWLVPVVAEVQRTLPDAVFEVFGGARVARLFAGIPRVTVLSPRPWPEYVAHCYASRLAVVLALLLPGRFNAVRSHTKVYDIARCGAVGVFSAREPYMDKLADAGVVLVPDDQEIWAREVIKLLRDDALRLEHFARTEAWLKRCRMSEDIGHLIG